MHAAAPTQGTCGTRALIGLLVTTDCVYCSVGAVCSEPLMNDLRLMIYGFNVLVLLAPAFIGLLRRRHLKAKRKLASQAALSHQAKVKIKNEKVGQISQAGDRWLTVRVESKATPKTAQIATKVSTSVNILQVALRTRITRASLSLSASPS